MAKIKRIVTSEVEGRNLSDFYGDNSLAMQSNGTINYYGTNEMVPLIAPGIVYGANHDSGDGYGYNTIKLIPHAPGGDVYDNRYIIVDPTTPNHIHLRAGGTQDDSGVELILGGERTNVVVDDSDKNVKINSKVQQQVMAHLNLNSESSEYLLTSDVVSATSNGWYAEVDGVRRYVADVTVGEGTLIYAPGASFAPNGVYNFFSPDYSNEWMFGTDGTFTGPGQNGTVKVNGLWGQDVSPLYLLGPESVVLDGDLGEFLNDPTNPANQIATEGYVNEAIPGQALETTDSPSFNKILVTNNDGTANNVKIGDDAWIGDLNQANYIAVVGAQDPTNGGIILGNSGTETISAEEGDLYVTSGGAMTIEAVGGDMNFYMDGGMYIGDSNSDNQIIKRSDLNSYVSPTMVRYQPTFAATGLTFTGSGETYPTYNSYYTKAGKMVSFVIEVDLSTVTNFGTGQYTLELPMDPAIGYNHFSGWAQVDTNVNPDVPNGHVVLNVDHAGITSTLDLHYLKQAGGAHTPIIEGLFLQGTPVTLTTTSKIYINGTYIAA